MKRLIISVIIFVILITAGCSTQHRMVESQFNYKGNFKEYNSFGFINPESTNRINGLNLYDNNVIESVIYKRFTAMGYEFDMEKPDLLITFRYFEEGTSLVTSDYQRSLKTWINSAVRDKDDQYLLRRVINDKGTLSIYFIDRESSYIIFQGFYKDYKSEDNSDYKIISSIGQLLDKYQVTAY
ncbi:MAG: DUF4136 domain-containing protein [Bacteroidota bacterium]